MTIEVEVSLQKDSFRLEAVFSAPARGVSVVFGPSGCGKTSLLRCLAGLEPAAKGRVSVSGQSWQDGPQFMPVHRRRLGMVFQEAALFSHLSVCGNLEFGARRRGGDLARLPEIAEMLGLRQLLDRKPNSLSGGERQRVALGRALLSGPELLLLDEPLSALDAGARTKLMPFIENALHAYEIPAIYVTHSIDELARLADHVVLMEAGRVVASGSLRDSLTTLESGLTRIEEAFGVLHGQVVGSAVAGLSSVLTSGGRLMLLPDTGLPVGTPVRLRIQARDISICLERSEKTSILNILPVVIEAISSPGKSGNITLRLALGEETLLARISAHSCIQLGLQPGQQVFAQVKAAALIV